MKHYDSNGKGIQPPLKDSKPPPPPAPPRLHLLNMEMLEFILEKNKKEKQNDIIN